MGSACLAGVAGFAAGLATVATMMASGPAAAQALAQDLPLSATATVPGGGAWVQIEARPTLAQAEERARAYATLFPDVAGFALPSGWYAITLGPFSSPEVARDQLRLLRREGMIPPDSYVETGGRFSGQFFPAPGGAPATDPGFGVATGSDVMSNDPVAGNPSPYGAVASPGTTMPGAVQSAPLDPPDTAEGDATTEAAQGDAARSDTMPSDTMPSGAIPSGTLQTDTMQSGTPQTDMTAAEPPLTLTVPPAPAAEAPVPEPLAPEAEPAPAPIPPETPAEARASEAQLSTAARMDLQRALAWEGFYAAGIDGAFGPGTRNSMAAWQQANGATPTGILDTAQRLALVTAWQADMQRLGLASLEDGEAGISLTMPLGLVDFEAYQPPFAHYAARAEGGPEIWLISTRGDAATLAALYEQVGALQAMPAGGPRSLGPQGFRLEGQDATGGGFAEASLSGGIIKGFIARWPAAQDATMQKVLAAMRASFVATPGKVLDAAAAVPSATSAEALMAGLEPRRPARARSGFYIDRAGHVLTTTEAVAQCARVTLDGGTQASVAWQDAAAGLAVLAPAQPLAPPAVAQFRLDPPAAGSELAVSGYAYAEVLAAPVMTFGKLAAHEGLDGAKDIDRLALASLPGDAGGPVVDAGGAVTGLLLPRAQDQARVLPQDVSFARPAPLLVNLLQAQGYQPETVASLPDTSLPAEALSRAARAMTVQVRCWQ